MRWLSKHVQSLSLSLLNSITIQEFQYTLIPVMFSNLCNIFDRYLNSVFSLNHMLLFNYIYYFFYTMFVQIYPLRLSIWDHFWFAKLHSLEFPLVRDCCWQKPLKELNRHTETYRGVKKACMSSPLICLILRLVRQAFFFFNLSVSLGVWDCIGCSSLVGPTLGWEGLS